MSTNHRNIMNWQGAFTLLFIFALIGFTACAGEGEQENASGDDAAEPQQEEMQVQSQEQSGTQTTIETQPNSIPQVTDEEGNVVFHFVCPNECEGSGGPGKATCPACGAEYVHNNEYHQYQRQQQQNNQAAAINPQTNGQIEMQQPSATNAQGEYHFICPEGCEGGAGTKTACANCGADLVHNDAYHN